MDVHERAKMAIKAKMSGVSWLTSKWRDPEYIKSRYTPFVGDKVVLTPAFSSTDILESLDNRRRRAKTDPYAAWDYISCTLSETELRTIVVPILKSYEMKHNK